MALRLVNRWRARQRPTSRFACVERHGVRGASVYATGPSARTDCGIRMSNRLRRRAVFRGSAPTSSSRSMLPLRTAALVAAATVALLIAPVAPSQSVAAQDAGADVIRGRVTGPDSLGIENVTVTATSMSSQSARTTRTDRNGRYTILFPGGGGDYLMSFAQLGFQPLRFEIKREGDE